MRFASNARTRLALAALLLSAAAARASDFTFTVPVDLRSLEGRLNHVGVKCEAVASVPAPAPAGISGHRIGSGATAITLTNGGFQGNVTVHFNATSGPLRDAKGYHCFLYFLNLNGEEVAMDPNDRKQGTTFTPDVRGALNP